ncbi:unnamed protein product [Heterotrigona itama]|uniref:Uncharacterized protein n=1 Tax=Heterotrigona itama TaxID=395501 RepID=A0A6V7GUI1_9HYME|nr:unnamed protein product [Heterotrigona itama]
MSPHVVLLQVTGRQSADNSSLKYGAMYEETKPRTIRAQFDKAEYEEMLNEHYETYSPMISQQVFKNTIIDTLRSKNSESLNSDFISLQGNIVMDKLATQSEEGIKLWKDMEKIGRKLDPTNDRR